MEPFNTIHKKNIYLDNKKERTYPKYSKRIE